MSWWSIFFSLAGPVSRDPLAWYGEVDDEDVHDHRLYVGTG